MNTSLNYFIVGAPKCGTTSLFYYLIQHPNVYDPKLKEPHFLCEEFRRIRVIRDDDKYEALFTGVTDEHIAVGEASMTYVYSAIALRRILEINPQAKILMLLRNPLEMLHSWHSHSLANMNENEPDFAKAWALQEERAEGRSMPPDCLEPFFLQYRQMGMLGSYTQRLYDTFPADNILLVFSEDLRKKTADVYKEVLAFLDLPPFDDVNFTEMNTNRKVRYKWLSRFTERPFAHSQIHRVEKLKQLLGIDFSFRQRLRRWNQPRVEREALDPAFKQVMIDVFRDDIALLEKLSGRDLSHWLR